MPRTIVVAAFALSLMCGTSAMAQHDHHEGGGGAPHGGGGGGAPHGGGGGGGAPHFSGGGGEPHFNAGAARVEGGGGAPRAFHEQGAFAPAERGRGGPVEGAQGVRERGGGHVHAGAALAVGAGAAALAASHGAHAHYSERNFPHEVRPDHQFHWHGGWNPPAGYYYRHWGYGDRLPYGWFARPFWITDFWLYDLPPAPYNYVWVRQGPDALLVNEYTGEVVEVEYGIFY